MGKETGSAALSAKRDALLIRARMVQAIRAFFVQEGFLEVETPVRIPAPAPEANIDAPPSGSWFLQTSPEIAMKRLLSAGYPKLFQICRCFREGERGARHLPEFTMLEWYRSCADYESLMADCENLLNFVAASLGVKEVQGRTGTKVVLAPPWKRITVAEAYRVFAGKSAEEALSEGSFDELMVERVEPHLGVGAPAFLVDYPAKLAALSRLKPGNPLVAERFELYIDGLELANGFSELNDPAEQRTRFERERDERAARGASPYPFPEKFLSELGNMPPSAGIALGLDRLAMLFAGKLSIGEVVAFTPEDL